MADYWWTSPQHWPTRGHFRLTGTDDADTLRGTDSRRGHDLLHGGKGDDTLYGYALTNVDAGAGDGAEGSILQQHLALANTPSWMAAWRSGKRH